jgi:hypothetical protein
LAQGVKATELDDYLHAGPRDFRGGHRKHGTNLGADRVIFLRGKSNFSS